ncbi:TPA: hypothetical protein ACSEXO_002885 [Proteus mirabilis]|uniref:Uncharacterized protein n=2 Tax=Proteus mirabilis TaxID=584 RepID=A0AAN4CA79_PROMI|nr:hypothetical protein [Proteus mirabilis]AUU13664.1 hypothetical protein MC53_006500 [Proteus mirabilis]EKU8116278.1 hypothetical protein [Proteus mirabilis]EKW9777621.1 hypothetical protein [Proteus mirabilis]ELA7705684.1 hypothetical protein [Proteus mirabilis]ELA9959632.1 hypothetical protein [Proteus mirabilis]
MNNTELVDISTFEEFESYVNQAIADPEFSLDITNLKFSIFDAFKMKIEGDDSKYYGGVNTTLAQGMSDFQVELNKIFAIIRYNTDNLQRLSSQDKKDLELTFLVNAGCTEILTSLTEFVKSIGDAGAKVMNGMTPNQKTLCVLFTVAVIGGGWGISNYANNVHDENMAQIQSQQSASERQSELDRLQLLKDGMLDAINATSNTELKEKSVGIENHGAKAYTDIIKSASDADNITISGLTNISLDQQGIQNVIKNPIEKLENKEDTIEVEIESIKRNADSLSVACRIPGMDYVFSISVNTGFIDRDETDLLFDAMKESKTVKILGNYKTRGGVIEKGNASSIIISN